MKWLKRVREFLFVNPIATCPKCASEMKLFGEVSDVLVCTRSGCDGVL
jgi:hypothetical protein